MQVLVTGGSGFIGRALCTALLASGHAVTVLSRHPARHAAALPGVRLIGTLTEAQGIEAVINLALPTSPGALADEADRVARLGIAYVQIPVLWEDPKPEQFNQFAAILTAFRGRKVWVHCAKNMRASAFTHLYRRRVLGHTEAEAGFPMREVWSPDETWSSFIQRVMNEPLLSGPTILPTLELTSPADER